MIIVHIITGLNTGGAEMMLYKLLLFMEKAGIKSTVISLTDIGPIGRRIQRLGIPVHALYMRRGIPNPMALLKLAIRLRRSNPDVVQTWMYHADLVGGIAAKLAGDIPVSWGIRHSTLEVSNNKRRTIWTAMLCARLSRWLPDMIVCCSEASRRIHAELGYDLEKMIMIPNGFDLDAFSPNPSTRLPVRQELGISADAPLIGLVGRFDPQKDHRNFIMAAANLLALVPDVHFLLCGERVDTGNHELVRWIKEAGLNERCHLLGRREDIPRLVAAFDVAASSSFGEGFPNAIGEAMACAIPCVVTDAGDSALIVAHTGRVVPPRDSNALAAALNELLSLSPQAREDLGQQARQRVQENYSLGDIVKQYEALYRNVAST